MVAPASIGVGSWGLVTGLAMVQSGLSTAHSLGLIMLVYSGSAQLAVLPLMATGASLPVIWLTALAASLRFIVHSAVVAGDFRRLPVRTKLLLGFVTADTALASYLADVPRDAPQRRRLPIFLGASFMVLVVWQIGSIIGVLLASVIPSSPKYAFVGMLAMLGMVAPMLRSLATVAAAIAAAAVSVLAADWPYKSGTFAAVGAAVAVALLIDRGDRRA